MNWHFLQDPSFGVFLAFSVFVLIAFRKALHKTRSAIHHYRSGIEKDLKDCESLLTEAQDALQESKLFHTQTHRKIEDLKEASHHQIDHMQQELEEHILSLRIQYEHNFEQRIKQLKEEVLSDVKHKIMDHALEGVRDTLTKKPLPFGESALEAMKKAFPSQKTSGKIQ